jgi:hypothetical protein
MSDMEILAQLSREEGEEQDYFRAQLAMRTAAATAAAAAANNDKLPDEQKNPSPRSSEEIWGEILYPTVKKRKASRRYPSPALKLRLPPFHISTGAKGDAILHGQNVEFARLLRKSDERLKRVVVEEEGEDDDGGGGNDGGGQRGFEQLFNNGMVEFAPSRAGLGLWDAGQEGRARLFEAAQWLMTTLFRAD